MKSGLFALALVFLVGCGSANTSGGGAQCPVGTTCSEVCPLTTDQQVYYLNKSDHTTGYQQATTFGGSIYCSGGQLMLKASRDGAFNSFSAGTYAQGTQGLLCGFTVDTSCAISNRSYPQ